MEDQYSNLARALRWIFYTALPSIFTYILACIYDLILGFTILQSISNHFLEFILMIFAISTSIFGSAMNIERKVSSKIKEIIVGLSVLCCFICLVFYGFLYYPSEIRDKKVVHFMQIVFAIIALFIMCLGFIFELKFDDVNSKNHSEKKEIKIL